HPVRGGHGEAGTPLVQHPRVQVTEWHRDDEPGRAQVQREAEHPAERHASRPSVHPSMLRAGRRLRVSSYPCPSLLGMTVDAVAGLVPAEVPEDGRPALPSLSPSRAADFKTCPLLYRFRTIDRLPERPSIDQARGTLVHAVLERLFDLPPGERTP